MGVEREPLGNFQQSAGFYLDAADDAANSGQARLAIHLYCAAFEVSANKEGLPSKRAIEGLRRAWVMALGQGDRSTAEAIFSDLLPYNTPDQTQEAIMQLQGLAAEQLEEIGLTRESLDGMAASFSEELERAGGSELAQTLRTVLNNLGQNLGLPSDEDEHPPSGKQERGLAPRRVNEMRIGPNMNIRRSEPPMVHPSRPSGRTSRSRSGGPGQAEDQFTFSQLHGFDQALAQMRRFGFLSAGDERFREFVEQASVFHGIEGLALMDSMLVCGPSREDNMLFARATAGEIGNPVLSMTVDLDDRGNGSIKISGPIKRSLFGPPDLTELPMPCTLLILNIDLLQTMFNNEREALRSGRHPAGPHGRSMQADVVGYLSALLHRGEVNVIATASSVESLQEPLLTLLGPLQQVEVPLPNEQERLNVLIDFADSHPSFSGMDLGLLAQLSEGLSRNDLVMTSRCAVEAAYRETLRTNRNNMVSLSEMLTHLSMLVDHNAPNYQRIEDLVVSQFNDHLDELL